MCGCVYSGLRSDGTASCCAVRLSATGTCHPEEARRRDRQAVPVARKPLRLARALRSAMRFLAALGMTGLSAPVLDASSVLAPVVQAAVRHADHVTRDARVDDHQ